nr:hypothetical protein [Bacilli bacterium]
KEKGMIAEDCTGGANLTLTTAKKYLGRIYSYIGTDEKDDFAVANNYDWLIENDEYDGYSYDDIFRDTNLVSTKAIIKNAMEFTTEAYDDTTYSNLEYVYDFYKEGTKLDVETSETLLADYETLKGVSSRDELISLSSAEFASSSYSGLYYYDSNLEYATKDGVYNYFHTDYSRLIAEAIRYSNLSAFKENHSSSVDGLGQRLEYLFSLNETKVSAIKNSYYDFIEEIIEKHNNGEGTCNGYENYLYYATDLDALNRLGIDKSFQQDFIGENGYTTTYAISYGVDDLAAEYILDIAGETADFDMIRAYLLMDYAARYGDDIIRLIRRSDDSAIVRMIGYNLTAYYLTSQRYASDYAKTEWLFDEIITALKENATTNGWLSKNGVLALKKKADKVRHSLFAEYEGVNFTFGDRLDNSFNDDMAHNYKLYLKNKAAVFDWFMYQQANAGFTLKQSAWLNMEPFTANAFYMPSTNSIYITMGYNFSKNTISEMSQEEFLACFGLVMGHETTHGFDSNGCYYDGDGDINYNTIFPSVDLQAFQNKQQEVIELYDTEVMPGVEQSGEVTLSEDLADIGGLGVSLTIASKIDDFDYESYFRYMAQNFMSKATKAAYYAAGLDRDVHPYAKARLNTLLMSSAKFQKTFNINEMDGMYRNPEEAIVIW